MTQKAFTLTEILLAVGIVGLLAALTAPGLLDTANQRMTKASAKTAYTLLVDVMEQLETDWENNQPSASRMGANPRSGTAYLNWRYRTKYNATNGTNSLTLNNGMIISSITGTAGDNTLDTLTIDINGASNPNTNGQDQFNLVFNYSDNTVSGVQPFDIILDPASSATIKTTWNNLLDVEDATGN